MLPTSSNKMLKKYTNKYFVETGTWGGYAVSVAHWCGFERIYTIEIDEEQYVYAKSLLEKHGYLKPEHGVSMFLGNSIDILPDIIPLLDAPATFWLDAHDTGVDENCPLYEELESIKQSPIKNHTIIIDDVRLFGTNFPNIDKKIVQQKLLEINPDYKITYEDGHIPNDIMVAYYA